MTEQEAKTKWCPYKELPSKTGLPDANCVASECMMWVWDGWCEGTTFKTSVDDNGEFKAAEADPPMEGHCGLAGWPLRPR